MSRPEFRSQNPPQSAQTIFDALAIIRRQIVLLLLVFVLVMVVTIVALKYWPKTYESEAKLFVRVGRESVALDPTATTGQNVSMHDAPENEIKTVLDIIESRAVLDNVVDELGPELILGKTARANTTTEPDNVKSSEASSAKPNQPNETLGLPLAISNREKAIRELGSAIDVSAAHDSRVIKVTSQFRNPHSAQTILGSFLDAFRVLHLRAHRTTGSYNFFEKQTNLLRNQLADAQAEFRDAKNELELVTIEGGRQRAQAELAALDTAIRQTEADFTSAQARAETMEQTLNSIPERLLTEEVSGFPGGPYGMTRRQLFELRIREQELLNKYTPHHHLVTSVQQQIQEAEAILAKQSTPGTQAIHSTNPAHQQMYLKMLDEKILAASARAKLASLEKQRQAERERLWNLNEQEGHIEELQQKVTLLKTNYGEYSQKLEQARIDRDLENERISNVNVVQAPTFNRKPVSPRKSLVLIAGFLVAVAVAFAIAFIKEFFDRTRSTESNDEIKQTQRPTTQTSETTRDVLAENTPNVGQAP